MKIEIEWRLKGTYGVADEDATSATQVDAGSIIDNIEDYVRVPGMEDVVKQLADALKKAREPPKTSDDKKKFRPVVPYDEIRRQIRNRGHELAEDIRMDRIEECSYDKCVVHLIGGNIEAYEKDRKKDTLDEKEWDAVDDFIQRICAMDCIDIIIGIKNAGAK